MFSWEKWLDVVGCLTSLSTSIYLIVLIFRLRRRMRELAEYRERLAELDFLLMHICTKAFMHRCSPVWTAWSQVMGDIEIQVYPRRKYAEDD
jgi:hypothetical protein